MPLIHEWFAYTSMCRTSKQRRGGAPKVALRMATHPIDNRLSLLTVAVGVVLRASPGIVAHLEVPEPQVRSCETVA